MTYRNAVTYVHALLQHIVQPGDVVVDATVGNGYDTSVLAELVGPTGTVYGFDIQAEAIASTRARLSDLSNRVEMFHAGHEELITYLPSSVHGSIRAVTFNLGYLPGGDKSCTTTTATTCAAVTQAMQILAPGGTITVVCYPHPEGQAEYRALLEMLRTVPQDNFVCSDVSFVNHPTASARVLCITRHASAGNHLP
ncbi:MAG: class I SAM-dependent methyltransferase [Candidatus Kapaibacteriota bacterium]